MLVACKVKAMSPLCHTSVSKWSLEAGVKDLHDAAKIERCIGCHGPGTPAQKPRRWNQQGHMECLMCHEDRTI